jgi:hypothetical protein
LLPQPQVYLGYLLGAYGLATMVSEGVLVRVLVPRLGERQTVRLGLAAFAGQCAVVGLATRPQHIWGSIALSVLSNLVYPSLSSLVSGSVPAAAQGEAQGAINGVRALTEGFGPLLFGALMHVAEGSPVPGAPYLVGGLVTLWALRTSYELPDAEAYAQWRDAKDDARDPHRQLERQGLLAKSGGGGGYPGDESGDDGDDVAGTFPVQRGALPWIDAQPASQPASQQASQPASQPASPSAQPGRDKSGARPKAVDCPEAVRPGSVDGFWQSTQPPPLPNPATSGGSKPKPKLQQPGNAKVWAEAKSKAKARKEELR